MRTWRRAALRLRCGRCGGCIAPGEAYEAIQTARPLTRPKARCTACAETAVPVVVPTTPPASVQVPLSFARFAVPPGVDFKRNQAGRDPGEDDQ